MAKTANEEVLDATIRHQIKLLRFSNGQAEAATALLVESDKELEALLQSGLTEVSEARVRALLADVRRLRTATVNKIGENLSPQLDELADTEYKWEGAMLSSSIPVSVALTSVPVSVLKAVSGSPINGVPLSGWLGSMALNDVSRIEQQVRLGVLAGETIQQMVQRVRGTKATGYKDGVLAITRREAEMITRTAVNHVSASARQETWNANADIIKGVRWVATLDGRTSPVCQSRDGEVYPIDKGPRPPAHPNCRSTVAPVLDGEQIVGDRPTITDTRTRRQREIDFRAEAKDAAGDKWKDMSAAERNDAIKAKRAKWADDNIGQAPTTTNYQTWLKGQSKEFQDDVLGKGKAELFRNGTPLDKFIDERGKPYSLQQLKTELEGDKLYVVQPGVGLKAKALLQQGLSPQEVLAQIKAEYPDASTSLASIASYKSELNKAGALVLPEAGKVPTGALKQAKAVADVVHDLDASLPVNVKYAIGDQWSTVVEELEGSPGVYSHYEAGKGVKFSGKKLSAMPTAQAKQVAAHELGHLLHKQHELLLSDDVLVAVKASANGLPQDVRKLYSYYLSSHDELIAEMYAQALSPSPLTSQGLSALDFNKAFSQAIQASKTALAEKFPHPPVGLVPTPGGPVLPFEVAGKHTTVGSLAKALLQQGMSDEQVLKSVLAEFPEAKTKQASIASYKSQLKKDGMLPSKGTGKVISAKPLADVVPVPAMPEAIAAAPDLVNVTPSISKVSASELKAKGLELMKSGVLGNKDIVSSLEKLYPLNVGEVNASQVATWKTLWKKADAAGYAKASSLSETATVKASVSGPIAKPKLAGVSLGPQSSKALESVKSVLAAGGSPADAFETMKKYFGATLKEPGATDLLDLAQYQLATAKAAGKPYLDAAFSVPSGVTLDPAIEKFVAGLSQKEQAALNAYKDSMSKGYGSISTNKIVKIKAGYEPSASAKVKLKKAAEYELKKQGAMPKAAEYAIPKQAPARPSVDMTPTRLASTPREGLPPPPRFNSAQRQAGLRKYAGSVEGSKTSAMNELQRKNGLPDLTNEEAAAIRSYTGSTYHSLNNALREGKYATDPHLQAYVDAAQHALGKMQKYVGLSARGMRLSGDKLKDLLNTYTKGAVIEDSAFISSSYGDRAAFGGNVFLKMNGKTGVNISSFSKYTGEREVLFMPGTQFRVDEIVKTNDTYVVTMTEI